MSASSEIIIDNGFMALFSFVKLLCNICVTVIIRLFSDYFFANIYKPEDVFTTSKKLKFIDSNILSISSFENL